MYTAGVSGLAAETVVDAAVFFISTNVLNRMWDLLVCSQKLISQMRVYFYATVLLNKDPYKCHCSMTHTSYSCLASRNCGYKRQHSLGISLEDSLKIIGRQRDRIATLTQCAEWSQFGIDYFVL